VTLDAVLDEALRLVAAADARGIPFRLLGGLGVAARVPDWRARADRAGRDIDVASNSKSRRAVAELLETEGYTPDRQYNGANGHKQLYFVDMERGRPVDVLIDRMEMCHTFEFASRLTVPGPSLPLADLLLSKLQVAKINRKDILDVLMLLAEFRLTDEASATDGIDVRRILQHTSADWGWWRTATGNLDVLERFVATELTLADLDVGRPWRFEPGDQVRALRHRIDEAPKSLAWKVRARVGERLPWYEEPEEIAHNTPR
jgi:hypothetical protein